MDTETPNPGGRKIARRRRRAVVAGVSAGLASLLAAATLMPSDPPAADAATAAATGPTIAQSKGVASTSDKATLTGLTAQPGDVVFVAVATQGWRGIDPTVSATGLTFERVTQVRNSQRIEDLTVFRAAASGTSGTVNVSMPGNDGSASVVGVRVTGAPTTANGADAVRAVVTNPGPTWAEDDNPDMQASVDATAGDLAIGFGTNRLRNFEVPSDQTAGAINVAAGADGERMVSSVWSAPVTGTGTKTLGGNGSLKGNSGSDDWATVALAVRPTGKVVTSPSTSTAPSTTAPATTTSPSTTASPSTTSAPSTTKAPTTTAAPTTTEAPTNPPASGSLSVRPYAADSHWNTPIPSNPTLSPKSSQYVSRIAAGPALTSDPTQYTYPIYKIDSSTPRRTVQMTGYFGTYTSDSNRVGAGYAATLTDVPVPPEAAQSSGTDGSIVFWDPATGDEWSFWQWDESNGQISATNGYRYNSKWSGRFFDGKSGRGAGLPYLGGLVRPWEIAQGHIDHALAFAYAWPSSEFVFPASKSDGAGEVGADLPEGSRLQLDPSLTDADFDQMGLSPAAKVIAKALQKYGMYVIDNSGSTKIMVEDNLTANWGNTLTRNSVSGISLDKFRVIAPTQ